MADELDIIATFLYSRLSANVTISGIVGTRIYQDVAPQGATLPYIVYASLAPHDIHVVGAIRIATRDEWIVKAVNQTSSYGGTLATLADAIDSELHAKQTSISGGQIVHSYREKPFRQMEVDNGIQYRSKGGVYNLMAQVS